MLGGKATLIFPPPPQSPMPRGAGSDPHHQAWEGSSLMLMPSTPHQGASFDPPGLSPHNPTLGGGGGLHSDPSPHQFPSVPYQRNCLLAPHLTGQALANGERHSHSPIGGDTSSRSQAPRGLCPTVLAGGRCLQALSPAGCPPRGWPPSPCLVLGVGRGPRTPCSRKAIIVQGSSRAGMGNVAA